MAILQCDMHSVNMQQHTGLLHSVYRHNRSEHKDVKTFRGLHADLTEEEHDWSHISKMKGFVKDSECAENTKTTSNLCELHPNISVIF